MTAGSNSAPDHLDAELDAVPQADSAAPAGSPPMRPAPPVRRTLEPTQNCVRCGREVALGVAMCEFCNPLGLAQPAATQAHGTIFLAIGVAVVALALLGRLILTGVGPFEASVTTVAATPTGLQITLTATNRGSRGGATTCRVHDASILASGPAAFFLSPQIEPGATVTFVRQTAALGTEVRPLAVECSMP
jgi:hypothetical protein